MRAAQLEYADTKAERVMLRAEVAMLQLTVAEAIGMGPRGREYGMIRAAVETSDDEGSGEALRWQPSISVRRQLLHMYAVYTYAVSAIKGVVQLAETSPGVQRASSWLLLAMLLRHKDSPCAVSLAHLVEGGLRSGACIRAAGRGRGRNRRRLRVRLRAVGRRVRLADRQRRRARICLAARGQRQRVGLRC